MPPPSLSVVVAVVEGGAALERCLAALAQQVDAPVLEVIVPYDGGVAEVGALAERFPAFRFLPLGAGTAVDAPRDALQAQQRSDRLRAAGLRAATAPLVAMLLDRGAPRPDWARQLLELQERAPAAAVGGAVENGAAGVLRRALFLCDFGRFRAPLRDDDAVYVSDANVCYRREALEPIRPLWEERYEEAAVHWALRRRGERLRLDDAAVVVHRRGPTSLRAALAERLHWGRNFGRVRGRECSRRACLLRALACPLLPPLLLVRLLRLEIRKRRPLRPVLAAAPAAGLLLLLWSLGEGMGYLDAALGPAALPESRRRRAA